MPRRVNELLPFTEPPRKKNKVVINEAPSLDVSFFDDEALPSGIVFNDVQQKKWKIGKPIGRGSFGRIYLASDEVDKEVTKANARYVVKIEPHTNGPLFVEIHCLIRTAQALNVKSCRQQKKLKHFGMPVYIASGSFTDENSGTKYRFLILPRYDIDLQKIIARTRVLDLKNVLVLALQILDVLEYLHGQGYTHSDIKSSNLMLGFDANKLTKNSVPKAAPSFQKEIKELMILSGKQRKVKTSKLRNSSYYHDEDFKVKDPCPEEEKDKKMVSVKNKLRKILSDKDHRTLHRHHAFNLRQISNYVNYEDFNSSVCSDQSYQKYLDEFENKHLIYSSDEGFHDDPKLQIKNPQITTPEDTNSVDVYKEAILSQSSGQIYLLDYGLASKFLDSEGNHKDFGMDARKAHDGTLEYSSRDSHIGAHSRRSDLETLAFNVLDWLTGTLPWKTKEVLAEPDLVHALKKNFMGDIKLLLKTCFKTEFYPQFMEKYFEYITSLDYTEKPDYDYCRTIFRTELAKNGYADKEISLNFSEPPMSPMSRKKFYASKRFGSKNTQPDFLARNGVKKAYERENIHSLENDLKLELLKQTLNSSSDGLRKPCTSRNFFISDADLVARLKKSLMPQDLLGKKLSPKNLRSKRKAPAKKRGKKTHRSSIGKFGNFMGSARQFTWAEILAGNPEDIIRKERNVNMINDEEVYDDDDETCKYRIRKLSNASESSDSNMHSPLLQKDYLQSMNPTYAMKEVIANLKKKIACKSSDDITDGPQGYTPAMMKLHNSKIKREAKERLEQAKVVINKIIPPVRCTRSSNTKSHSKATTKKLNKKQLLEIESTKQVESSKESINTRRKNNHRKISTKKCTKTDKNEQNSEEVKVADPSKKTKNRTDPPKKARDPSFATNRRRLRSSRRNKK